MKILVMFGTCTFLAFAQPKDPVRQKAGDCSVNIIGNNNTMASLICYGLDPKLAEQVRAILNGTWHNEKVIESISKQLAVIQKELDKPTLQIQQHSEGPNSPNTVNINQRPPSRRIPPEKRTEMVAILARHPATISVSAIANNAEAFQFAQDWYDAFKSAGWIMKDAAVRGLLGGVSERGILVTFHGETIPPGTRSDVREDSSAGAIVLSIAALKMTEMVHGQGYLNSPENEFGFVVFEQPEN
ncbi:MAG: hypothetical protein JWQ87_68 [Candidatus Sulfotelmatobacter sp.]|nr:hypothetical protein [Candidatus Sulfotelmatobacter sp.]